LILDSVLPLRPPLRQLVATFVQLQDLKAPKPWFAVLLMVLCLQKHNHSMHALMENRNTVFRVS